MEIRSPTSPPPTNANKQMPSNQEITLASLHSGGSMFEPETVEHQEMSGNTPTSNIGARQPRERKQEAPEKKLTLFALRLALFEKTASGLGALGFIWATVVLLGGFAIVLETTDFWYVTIILLVEGGRIYSRSHELEWQHEATWYLSEAGRNSILAIVSGSNRLVRAIGAFRKPVTSVLPYFDHQPPRTNPSAPDSTEENQSPNTHTRRTWLTSEVPLLPYARRIFVSRNISRIFYCFQLAAALACVVLSLLRLSRQSFGETDRIETKNRKLALNIFYGLALAEASVFLAEKAYWEWKVRIHKILEQVNKECSFDPPGIAWIRRFFYDAYSKSVNGSIFDGLKMDLLAFSVELLQSNSAEEQLTAARMLDKFTESKHEFSAEAFRRIGTSMPVMERLVEMLSWKTHIEEEIRMLAAKIVSKITGKRRNSLRVAGIPGAMESISSLLNVGEVGLSQDGIHQKMLVVDEKNYEYSAFNLLGLKILKNLANEHDNCGKIGSTRGLLTKIIDFTRSEKRILLDKSATRSQIMTVKRSLKLVKKLTTETGTTGEGLRGTVSSIVFTVGNLRDILQYGERHRDLQSLAADILTSMALDKVARDKIGSTGGMIKLLFGIFLEEDQTVYHENSSCNGINHKLRTDAGEALVMLALESQLNCERILRLDMVGKLVQSLHDSAVRINSARILRNLCAYAGPDFEQQLNEVTKAATTALKAIVSEEGRCQEAAIGLAAQILKFTNSLQFQSALTDAGTHLPELAEKLVQILQKYPRPSIKVPRMRRFIVELMISMMRAETKTKEHFKKLELEKELLCIAETTTELECFNVFSGSVGLSPHTTSLHSLVELAHELLVLHDPDEKSSNS